MVVIPRHWRRLVDLSPFHEPGRKSSLSSCCYRFADCSLWLSWQALDGGIYAVGSISTCGIDCQTAAALIKLDASGAMEWHKTYDDVSELYYSMLSADNSKLIVLVEVREYDCTGRESCLIASTVTIGSFTFTRAFHERPGSSLSFIASLNPADGSVLWAADVPGGNAESIFRLSSDGASLYVVSRMDGGSGVLYFTDSQGQTTKLRSLGSLDLVVMKFNASNGAGIWAIDGGGDGMEWFEKPGIDGHGNFILSGFSQSGFQRFGEHSTRNPQAMSNGGDGQGQLYTIQLSATDELPSCVTSCDSNSNTPVIAPGKCLIDNYCYDDGEFSPYQSNPCYKCDVSASQTEWTGPDTAKHCYLFGAPPLTGFDPKPSGYQCYADGEGKTLAPGRYGPEAVSPCLACIVAESTSEWSVRNNYDYTRGTCNKLKTIAVGPMTAPSGIKTPLGTAMAASTKVEEIVAAIADLAAAKSLYVGSTLQTLARTNWAGTSDFDAAAAHFGSATWLDDYLLAAFDGTGQFSGGTQERRELSGDDNHTSGRGDMINARTKAVRAALQNQILVMAFLSSAASNTTSDANWDLAYAYWHGGTPSAAPYASADELCKSYGTCSTGDGITARANFAVLKAIAEGKQAAVDGDAAAASAAFTALRGAALGVYYQAALRSAFQMDDALNQDLAATTTGHQGEGNSVWRMIAPTLNEADASRAEYVTDFFKMTNTPSTLNSRYCPLKFLLDQNLVSGFNSTRNPEVELVRLEGQHSTVADLEGYTFKSGICHQGEGNSVWQDLPNHMVCRPALKTISESRVRVHM